MKKFTFTVHDCGCVDLDVEPSEDGFEFFSIAHYLLTQFHGEGFYIVTDALSDMMHRTRRSKVCLNQGDAKRHLN